MCRLARGARPSLFTLLWAVLIGGFLWQGASASIRTAKVRRLVDTVWVRVRNPKAVGLESWGAPTAPGELGQLAFLLCNNFDTARPGDPASAYDTSCQGFAPGRDRSKSYRIRHEDLETVSPISMRIIFES